MLQPKGKKVKKNVEPEVSVEAVSYTHLDVYKRQVVVLGVQLVEAPEYLISLTTWKVPSYAILH